MLDYYMGTLGSSATYKWDFTKFVPDLITLNLGTNDYSTKPWPETYEYVQRLSNFIA